MIGPWWVTISTGIMVLMLGFLWSYIFKQQINTYLPFFAVGFVIWNWMAFQIIDASLGFFNFTAIIKQIKIPFLVFTLRLASRQLIILMHNLIIIVLVLLLVGKGFNWISLIAIPSFIIVQMNLIFLSLVIAIFCTRYQDMSQVVTIGVQLIFFFTPILWNADTIKTKKFIFELNPIYHWIEIIRAPLIGNIPSVNNYFWSGFTLIILSLLATYCVGRYQGRIAYWL